MKPLSKKRRVIVLITLVIIFIFGAPTLILYSTGYRLDNALSLVKTGGIFIHSDLSGTKVYVDDEFIENNGLILRNTLIQDLRPNKRHKVRVEKEGFFTWNKDLLVLPNLVTEGSILMIPTDIKFEDIPEFIKDKEEDKKEGEVVKKDTSTLSTLLTPLNPEYKTVGALFENSSEQFEMEVSTTTVKTIGGIRRTVISTSTEIVLPASIELLEIPDIENKEQIKEKNKIVTWLEDGVVKVVWAGKEEAIPFFFCQEECNDEISVFMGENIKRYEFFPGRDDALLILTNSGLFVVEIDNRSKANMHPIFEAENIDFRVEDNITIFIKDGDIFKKVLI